MFTKVEFIRLVKKANYVSWSATKSSMTPLIGLLPASGPLMGPGQVPIQEKVWPTVLDLRWVEKKKKYRDALVYMLNEALGMDRNVALRVLLKKGEAKRYWQKRTLSRDCRFTHTTGAPDISVLNPRNSTEFCYPDNAAWGTWDANEFIFCVPKIEDGHKQKGLATFGARVIDFIVPVGTDYYAQHDVTSGVVCETAFFNKLRIVAGRATVELF